VAAWKTSVEGGAPFTALHISDLDEERLKACTSRLKALGAPVHPISHHEFAVRPNFDGRSAGMVYGACQSERCAAPRRMR
jgi:hypothetical protein